MSSRLSSGPHTPPFHNGFSAHVLASRHQFEERAMGLRRARAINETAILAIRERHVLQIIATAGSSVTVLSTLVAVYWFCMMRKNFRRDLILLLFIGDFFKSLWIMTFACYTFVHGPVISTSNFCQASGYLLLTSIELCDLAILIMSIHLYLQIFPWSSASRDGLYGSRKWVYAVWFILPNVIASLAFINSGPAFVAAGPLCTLPVRPLWYRLALSWVPRYLIWLFLMTVAIRIYFFVGREFTVFKPGQDGVDSTVSTGHPTTIRSGGTNLTFPQYPSHISTSNSHPNSPHLSPYHAHRDLPAISSFPPHHVSAGRRFSTPDWSQSYKTNGVRAHDLAFASKSLPGSRRGSQQTGMLEDKLDQGVPNSVPFNASATTLSQSSASLTAAETAHLPTIVESKSVPDRGRPDTANDAAARMIAERRRAMQRQLRLLFIYPVVYIIMWFFPFVTHCLNYSDRYAQSPVFPISVLNILCQATMGFVDVCVFSSREKPWKHITGSDGTFLGSFKFYRFCQLPIWLEWIFPRQVYSMTEILEAKVPSKPSSAQKSFFSWASIRKTSLLSGNSQDTSTLYDRRIRDSQKSAGKSMQRQLEVERAQQRLALERADQERNRKERGPQDSATNSTIADQHGPMPSPSYKPKGRREWWDTDTNNDLFRDDAGQDPGKGTIAAVRLAK